MTHNTIYSLYTDGGSRGNPGPGALGVVIKKDGEIVKSIGRCIGNTTNNQAEYQALVLGLELSSELTSDSLECFLDSELIVKQLNGQYRVKDEKLIPLYNKVKKIANNFEKISFSHIRREKNKEADALVNLALDKQ